MSIQYEDIVQTSMPYEYQMLDKKIPLRSQMGSHVTDGRNRALSDIRCIVILHDLSARETLCTRMLLFYDAFVRGCKHVFVAFKGIELQRYSR